MKKPEMTLTEELAVLLIVAVSTMVVIAGIAVMVEHPLLLIPVAILTLMGMGALRLLTIGDDR